MWADCTTFGQTRSTVLHVIDPLYMCVTVFRRVLYLCVTSRLKPIFRTVRRGQTERKQKREQRSRGLVYNDQSVNRAIVAWGQKKIPAHTHRYTQK